ncbi:MAG: putative DCC family thiol-disulfide oxidoreductase YuxK [Glaciecola sp.]|jgi:predicted DCC family thiol-disulfide oxidoreductase YuxK|uniref:thiol-disulfide oxidoreductase DCC family protein n=1 Tax=Congregibacter sp. TaxID=2744308 RepID=UPI0039E40540
MSVATRKTKIKDLSSSESTALTNIDNDDSPSVDTLFFDGQCPLCASEIAQLRKARGGSLRIVDIHGIEDDAFNSSDIADAANPEPGKDQLLRVLHLRRADGSWLKSADANVAAWEGTTHGRVLRILRWPLIRHFADAVYALWATWRYKRLYGKQFTEKLHAPDS